MIKKYLQKHFQFNEIFNAAPSEEDLNFIAKRKRKLGFFIFLQFLKFLPIVCGIGFGISFFWDFGPDDQVEIVGQSLKLEALLRMVTVSGLIGFGTNWVAVKNALQACVQTPDLGTGIDSCPQGTHCMEHGGRHPQVHPERGTHP